MDKITIAIIGALLLLSVGVHAYQKEVIDFIEVIDLSVYENQLLSGDANFRNMGTTHLDGDVYVDGDAGINGHCAYGYVPEFKEGIAVGCSKL